MATASMMLSKTMFLAQARALWRRRWYAVLVAWSFCLVGWIYVAFMPNIFEAKTRIYVDTDSMLRPLMHGIAIDPNVLSVVDIMQRTLLCRPNLLKVIHMADLDLGASGPTATEDLLKDLRKAGKRVVGYGATSKSTTVTNYCAITPQHVEFISDTTPIKQGKLSPGAHIPVKPYEAFKSRYPDYALLFAWNHADEIREKEGVFVESGGKWIVYVPELKVL